jgi:tetratricopeptide (TPR) repeat protein
MRSTSFVLSLVLVALVSPVFGTTNAPQIGGQQTTKATAVRKPGERFVTRVGPEWTPFTALSIDTKDLPLLMKALNSPDRLLQARAAFIAGQVRYREAVPRLLKLLTAPDQDVRRQCGIALACMGLKDGIGECKTALDTGPDWTRYYAAYGLWCINAPEARAALSASTSKQSDFVKEAIDGAASPRTVDLPCMVLTNAEHKKLSLDQIWYLGLRNLVREGDWWYHRGKYDQTIRCQEAALLLCPKNADLYATNAYLLWSMGRNDDADNTLFRGVAADPKSWETHYELGQHYMMTKRYAMAEPELKLAVKYHGPILVCRLYAHDLEKVNKLKEALKEWEEIVREYPKDGAAIKNRDRVRKLLHLDV